MTQLPPVVPAAPPPGSALKPHRGVLILVFGNLSIVCCLIFGIVAWAMANTDLREIAAGQMDPAGKEMARIGKIFGMIGIVVQIIFIIVYAILFALFGLSAFMPMGGQIH